MYIKIQSSSISFDEFAEAHPDSVELIPTSHGLDGIELYAILLPFALEVIKDVVGYIAKKIIEKKEKEKEKAAKATMDQITVVFSNGSIMHIPFSDFNDRDDIIKRVVNEIGKVTD